VAESYNENHVSHGSFTCAKPDFCIQPLAGDSPNPGIKRSRFQGFQAKDKLVFILPYVRFQALHDLLVPEFISSPGNPQQIRYVTPFDEVHCPPRHLLLRC
jgi:hypothetical protein